MSQRGISCKAPTPQPLSVRIPNRGNLQLMHWRKKAEETVLMPEKRAVLKLTK